MNQQHFTKLEQVIGPMDTSKILHPNPDPKYDHLIKNAIKLSYRQKPQTSISHYVRPHEISNNESYVKHYNDNIINHNGKGAHMIREIYHGNLEEPIIKAEKIRDNRYYIVRKRKVN